MASNFSYRPSNDKYSERIGDYWRPHVRLLVQLSTHPARRPLGGRPPPHRPRHAPPRRLLRLALRRPSPHARRAAPQDRSHRAPPRRHRQLPALHLDVPRRHVRRLRSPPLHRLPRPPSCPLRDHLRPPPLRLPLLPPPPLRVPRLGARRPLASLPPPHPQPAHEGQPLRPPDGDVPRRCHHARQHRRPHAPRRHAHHLLRDRLPALQPPQPLRPLRHPPPLASPLRALAPPRRSSRLHARR